MFFSRDELGICAYSFEKYLAIQIEEDKISYAVNQKPTFKNIKGNYSKGFIYTVGWDDDKHTHVYNYKIDCFNKNLDTRILDRMIALANQIPLN
jgi:hypothetical protein